MKVIDLLNFGSITNFVGFAIPIIIVADVTIEDIHKVRENNYNITKDMTPQERRDYYNKRGMDVHRKIQERKMQKV